MTMNRPVIVQPMLSPVLEDFVPPQFRGNIPDSPLLPADAHQYWKEEEEADPEQMSADASGNAKAPGLAEAYSNAVLKLLRWRPKSSSQKKKRAAGGVPVAPPVKIHNLHTKTNQPSSKGKAKKAGRSALHSINPMHLFAKLRDTYVHMMNGAATSSNVVGANYGTVYTQREYFSQEFDSEAREKLVELQRSNSVPDGDYRQRLIASRNRPRRVEPFTNAPVPQLNRQGSRSREARGHFTRFAPDDLSDEKFFSKSRSKKAAVGPNPYKEPFALPARRSRSTSTGSSVAANNNVRNSTPQLPSDKPNLDAARIDSDYWLKQAAEEAAPMFSFQPL